MNLAVAVMALALGWAAITGNFSLLNLLLGALVAGLAIFFLRVRPGAPRFWHRLVRIAGLAAFFLYELLLSAVQVAALVVRPNLGAHLQPAIIAFPLRAKTDAEITLLANLISLTPGTLSVDVSVDRQVLYIHVLSLKSRDALTRGIAEGFEKKVIEVFE